MKKCTHKFQLKSGGCYGGLVSHHGECSKCGIELTRMGKIDENGDGTIWEKDHSGDHSILYLVKNHNVVKDKGND